MTQLYPHQIKAIDIIFETLQNSAHKRILFQLPTGAGKTVIFSEIARRFIMRHATKTAILTHRNELCLQTSATLKKLGVSNKIISAATKTLAPESQCYVAMVETLKNRVKTKSINVGDIGLVIVDEAHHNAFRKMFKKFPQAIIIGVTATPLSADMSKPMNRYYDTLILGENITSLIGDGYLAQPKAFEFPVELNSLKTGIHGDYTVSSSNELYGSEAMLDLLATAYEKHAKGKKTLIFNNGIVASQKVCEKLANLGIAIRHIDNKCSGEERSEILQWFRKTKGAVLTSVSILTTGFDEPSVQAIILNRATTSLTLYHQMVGRGARCLATKKTFTIIDLGNNIKRFGAWNEPVDWMYAFNDPQGYAAAFNYCAAGGDSHFIRKVPAVLRSKFPKTLEFTFDVAESYLEATEHGKKPKSVISQSLRQQALMCIHNADGISHALELADDLAPEIEWRISTYVKCLGNASSNYKKWLIDDYQDRLKRLIVKIIGVKSGAA